jgi:hypothetical protein
MTDTPRLVTTLGLPRKVELGLLKRGLFSVEQLKKIGTDRIKAEVGTFGLRWVKRQLKKAGMELPIPASLGRKAPNRDAEIQRLYLAGESLHAIGDIFGLSHQRIGQLVDKIFPPQMLERAKQTHFENYHAPRIAAKKYLMQIAETHNQAAFIKETGISYDILVTMLPDVNARIKAHSAKDAIASIKARAQANADKLRDIIADIRIVGTTTFGGIAAELNERQVPTPRGDGQWYASSVSRLLARL